MSKVAKIILQGFTDDDRLGKNQAADAEQYLRDFGYFDNIFDSDLPERLPECIENAQTILGIKPDGVLGRETWKAMMGTPRCGCTDAQKSSANHAANQWYKAKARKGLTYHIMSYVNGLGKGEQEKVIIRAWESWEKVCGLKMIRKSATNADILIYASANRREEFGTPGNVLAWAYLPQGNQHTRQLIMKFDLAETWIGLDSNQRGILMENVACHEFGHLLGLDHTKIRGELMYPTYDPKVRTPQPKYDIPSVTTRYGKTQSKGSGDPLPPTPKPGAIVVTGTININGQDFELTPKK